MRQAAGVLTRRGISGAAALSTALDTAAYRLAPALDAEQRSAADHLADVGARLHAVSGRRAPSSSLMGRVLRRPAARGVYLRALSSSTGSTLSIPATRC